MGIQQVVKANWLNMAFAPLSLGEMRLLQLAVIDARETGCGLSPDKPLRIHAARYAEAFDTSRQNAYDRLKEAEKSLFNRQFSFVDDDGCLIKSHWVQDVKYKPDAAYIEVCLTRHVVRGIERIDGFETYFTKYMLSQTVNLTSVYAVRLYELIIQWRDKHFTPIFYTDSFRAQLGVGVDEYKAVHDFKKRVLLPALQQISEHTDIIPEYQQHKTGRVISGFSFKFKQKSKPIDVAAKPKKTEPPKASSAFAGLQLILLKQIQSNHPEITEKYVRDYAEQSGLDIVQVLEKIKADYKAAEEFSLEKTN